MMEGGEMEQEAEGRRAETRRVNGGETTRKSKTERETSGRRLDAGHASHFEETLDIGGFRSSLSRVHKCFRPTCCLLGDIYTSCTSLCGLLCKNNLTSHARMTIHVDRFAFWLDSCHLQFKCPLEGVQKAKKPPAVCYSAVNFMHAAPCKDRLEA